jgi:hypothetical protein
MKREDFVEVAEEAVDSLPEEFRSRLQNAAILVGDFPPNQSQYRKSQQRQLLLGVFHGVPATKKSFFDYQLVQPHRALSEEHRSGLFERSGSPPPNPPDAHSRTGALFREGGGATKGCIGARASDINNQSCIDCLLAGFFWVLGRARQRQPQV